MGLPYKARIDERHFLELPGVGVNEDYVFAYVEDTSRRDLEWVPECGAPECDAGCNWSLENFEPRVYLELGRPGESFRLQLFVEGAWRDQALHAIDTLTAALQAMRTAFVAEGDEYDRRERQLEDHRSVG